jgi:EAL domain-containing protein (putative c-di-GMP-specific phosphodiesterase class I)
MPLSNQEIDRAFEHKAFELFYQPISSFENGGLVGGEISVRWRHPSLGLLSPGLFLAHLDAQGRRQEILRYVLHQGLTDVTMFRAYGVLSPIWLNLSANDLADGLLAASISLALEQYRIDGGCLVLSLSQIDGNHATKGFLASKQILSDQGLRMAIDVSASSIDAIKPDDLQLMSALKLGGRSLLHLARDLRGTSVCKTNYLVRHARNSGLEIVASSVDAQSDIDAIDGLGFSAAMGVAIAEPLTAAGFHQFFGSAVAAQATSALG